MRRDSDRIAELRREIEANPHSRQFYQLGELLRRDGRFEEAAAVLRRGLQHWPKYVAAWVSLGRAELERGAADGAMAALERAIELDPENPVAWRLLAEGREVAGEVERALAAMRRAAALVPGDETLMQGVERLEALAVAAPPAPPPVDEGQREPGGLGSDEGAEADVEETAVMPAAFLPLPEGFAAPPPQEAAPPVEESSAARTGEGEAVGGETAEVFAVVEPAAVTEAAPGSAVFLAAEAEAPLTPGPFVELETAPTPVSAQAAAEPTGAAAVPWEDEGQAEALPSPVVAVAPTEAVAEVEESAEAEQVVPLAPPPAAEPRGALEDPFAGLESQPEAPPIGREAAAGEVFALETPAPAGGLEDVFGPLLSPPEKVEPTVAPLPPLKDAEAVETPLPPVPEPLPAVEAVEVSPPSEGAEASPWATQARLVIPVPPPLEAAAPAPAAPPVAGEVLAAEAVTPLPAEPLAAPAPAPEAPPVAGEVLAAETVAQLPGEPLEELWPPVGGEVAPPPEPEPVPEAAPAPPAASVEAARALIRAERLAEAAAMLEKVAAEHPDDGEARDLLELVRDMLEPMPVELPPPSLKARKIAALQRWLASLTLARERAAL